MIRRLLLILLAVTQIAALPLSIEPKNVMVGSPLTITISLPNESTTLVGFPDLDAFALLEEPERIGDTLTIRLLPLRAGDLTIPALPFQTGRRLDTTESTILTIDIPTIPESPHPLRPLPKMKPTPQTAPVWSWIILVIGLAVTGLLIASRIRYRRPKRTKQALNLEDQFSDLAAAAALLRVVDDPEWDRFFQQLDRIRFGPLPHSDNDLQEFTAKLTSLRGEAP
jgi:hypothetical protein